MGRLRAAPYRELTAHAGILDDPGMRFFASLFALCLATLPAAAQAPNADAPKPAAKPAETKPSTIDDLFDRLAKAKDEAEGKGIASLIERRWSRSGSDTSDLLMNRAVQAIEAKEHPLAIELLDRVIALQPQWTEAWYRRANVFYLLDDPASAMADLRQVLDREPRHFGAWTGLGHIFMASEDKARALASYRRALEIYPQLSSVQSLVERLAPQVDGQDL
jgi:tetratricopeptide (TPR) repeat protein